MGDLVQVLVPVLVLVLVLVITIVRVILFILLVCEVEMPSATSLGLPRAGRM